MTVSIFDSDKFSNWFAALVQDKKSNEPAFSYRNLARRVGCPHHHLILFAQGKRLPPDETLSKLGPALKLSEAEMAFAFALVGMERAKTSNEREFYAEKLASLRPHKTERLLGQDADAFMSQWYHAAILEMFGLAGFAADPEKIAERLRGDDVTAAIAGESLALLERLGFIARDETGRSARVPAKLITAKLPPSPAIRQFHKQQLARAAEAIEMQTPENRFVSGSTVTIEKAELGDAFRMITEFRSRFIERFQKVGGDATYHLALQLFELTK